MQRAIALCSMLMDLRSVLVWMAVVSSALLFLQAAQAKPPRRAWAIVAFVVGAGSLLAHWLWPALSGYVAGALWGLLIIAPSVLARRAQSAAGRQDYARAQRWMKLAAWFHPSAEMRMGAAQLRAMQLAQRGQIDAAERILQQLTTAPGVLGVRAQLELFRLGGRWAELVELARGQASTLVRSQATLALPYLRALGETGARGELVSEYAALARLFTQANHEAWHDVARLFLFAFCGRPELVARLLEARMPTMRPAHGAFWVATAQFAAGLPESASALLAPHLQDDDAQVRSAIALRLATPLETASTPAEAPLVEAEAAAFARDLEHGPLPSGARRRTPAVIGLSAAIALVFALQLLMDASTSAEGLYRMGALWQPSVLEGGQWWRLFTFQLLHAGALHVTLNLLGLWALGRDVEPKLGAWRTLLVYAVSGTAGGLLALLLYAAELRPASLLVGASGGVMGFAGALAALALRAVIAHDTPSARRKFFLASFAIAVQSTFDLVTPQISMVAHLSGAASGFLLTWLTARRAQPSARRVR